MVPVSYGHTKYGIYFSCSNKMADGCLLILCGVPASGKSTLANELISMNWKIAKKCVHFIYVRYDDFIPERESSTKSLSFDSWKAKRKNILNGLEEWILLTAEYKHNVSIAGEKPFNERRNLVSKRCSCAEGHMTRAGDIFHVIVIDDNMYYRSMRYEYYQLARKASFGFAEIYIYCALEFALSRNAKRFEAVAEDTIVKMINRFEKPDPQKFPWEKCSITLDATTSETTSKWEMILELLENAARNVPPPVKVLDEKEKIQDRAITEKNIVHQADQVIRKHISARLQQIGDTVSREHLKQLALSLNKRRKKLVEMIRNDPRTITRNILLEQSKFSLKIKENEMLQEGQATPLTTSKCFDYKFKDQDIIDKGLTAADVHTATVCSKELQPSHADHRHDIDKSLTSTADELERLLFLENIWDVVSVDEFAGIIRNLFESCS